MGNGTRLLCAFRILDERGNMTNRDTLIREACSAFNARDSDGALALMNENVRWPKASEGGHVVGKEGLRAYWTRQWQTFDPHVTPTELIDRVDGRTAQGSADS